MPFSQASNFVLVCNITSPKPNVDGCGEPVCIILEHLEEAIRLENQTCRRLVRKQVIEDATFGLRAAGPAVLSNNSMQQHKTIEWDPQTMTVKG